LVFYITLQPSWAKIGEYIDLDQGPNRTADMPLGGGCTAASTAYGFATEFGDGCNNFGAGGAYHDRLYGLRGPGWA